MSSLEIADEKDHSPIKGSVSVTETEEEVQSPINHQDLQQPDQDLQQPDGEYLYTDGNVVYED